MTIREEAETGGFRDWEFPVRERDVFVGEEGMPSSMLMQSETSKAIVRPDTGDILAIVSKEYTIVRHRVLVDAVERWFRMKGEEYESDVRLTHNGARMYASFLMTNREMEIGDGDCCHPRVTITNSYDASMRVWCEFGAFRLICSNGMYVGQKLHQGSRKHVGSDEGDIVAVLTDFLGKVDVIADQVLSQWDAWHDCRVNLSAGVLTIDKLSVADKWKDAIKARWYSREDPRTLWGLYNAITYVMTHETGELSMQYKRTIEKRSIEDFTVLANEITDEHTGETRENRWLSA